MSKTAAAKVVSPLNVENSLSGSNLIYQRGGYVNLRYPQVGSPYIGGLPRDPETPILMSPSSMRKVGRREVKWTDRDTSDQRSHLLEDVTHYELDNFSDEETDDTKAKKTSTSSSTTSVSRGPEEKKDADESRSPSKDKKKTIRRRRSKDDGDATKTTATAEDSLIAKGSKDEKTPEGSEERMCRQCEDCVIM
mgnify:CR=1 FL=1